MKKQLKKQIEQLQQRVELIERLEKIGLPKYLTEVNITSLNCESKYSMGETFTLSYKGQELIQKDNRREYTGRGVKYNKTIKYGKIVVDIATKKDLANLLQHLSICYNAHDLNNYMAAFKVVKEIINKYSTQENIEIIQINK